MQVLVFLLLLYTMEAGTENITIANLILRAMMGKMMTISDSFVYDLCDNTTVVFSGNFVADFYIIEPFNRACDDVAIID